MVKITVIIISIFPFFMSNVIASEQSETFRAVVRFSSICCDPDLKDERAVQIFIESFEEKHNIKILVTNPLHGEGPEGEWSMCFKLSEIDQLSQVQFIKGIRKAIENIRLKKNHSRDGETQIIENSPCK